LTCHLWRVPRLVISTQRPEYSLVFAAKKQSPAKPQRRKGRRNSPGRVSKKNVILRLLGVLLRELCGSRTSTQSPQRSRRDPQRVASLEFGYRRRPIKLVHVSSTVMSDRGCPPRQLFRLAIPSENVFTQNLSDESIDLIIQLSHSVHRSRDTTKAVKPAAQPLRLVTDW